VRSKHLAAIVAIAALALVEVAVLDDVDIAAPGPAGARGPAADHRDAPPPYDVTPLRKPAGKYLGVTVQGGVDMARIEAFADAVGTRPNLVSIFESFDDEFAASEVRKVYEYGGLAAIRWEPFDIPMRDIAAGKHDDYIRAFARAVHALNLPIALSFAHEMNGHWYSWGTKGTTAEEYVAAWRHIHQIFQQEEATNVLWTWTPNVINPVPRVRLAPLYPGDEYVDWVGIDGYYTVRGAKTFDTLFGPTITEIRRFTAKPILIMETGVEPSASRPAQIRDLLVSVARSPDVIGLAYFNIDGSGRWNLDKDGAALRAFRENAQNAGYGFDVRDPQR
jgi:hypothetical protein